MGRGEGDVATWTDRLRAAWRALQVPAAPSLPPSGELAFADPSRLFPGGFSTPYNPSALIGRRGYRILDQMRLDDQVKAALALKKHSVLASGWTIASPEGLPDDWVVTRFVEQVWRNLDPPFDEAAMHILSALDYGFSVAEKVWAEVDGQVVLAGLRGKRPHDFDFDVDPWGRWREGGVLQRQQTFGPVRLPPEKFIVFSYDGEWGNRYGRSDLEAAYRPWWIKDNAYKWLAILLESLGVPPVIGLYDPARYTPQQIDDLKQALENLQARTFGIFPRPQGADALEFWTPELAGQAARVFLPALEAFDRAIARAILMPGLLGMTPEQQQGSFARARVQFDVFVLVIESLRRSIANALQVVVRELVDYNFSVDAYPEFRWLPMTDEVRLDILDRWQALVGVRVVTPQPDDEAHIRAMLGFPERTIAAPSPQAPPGDTEAPQAVGLVREFRQPDALERHVRFAQIERTLDQLEAEAHDAMREALQAVRDELVARIERRWDDLTPSFVDGLQLRLMGDVQETMREFLRSAYAAGTEALRSELPRAHQERGPTFVPTDALRWLAAKALTITGVLRDRLAGEAKQIIFNALKIGEPQRETLRKLRDLFEPYLGDPTVLRDDEVVAPHRLEAILRTNATEAFNMGRVVQARDPRVAGLLRGMRYSAVIDSRTTEVCRFLDGRIIPMDEPELDRLAPPNHWNCRSLLVPVTLDMTVREEDLITPAQIGKAKELIQEGFK
jgi:SPP1 gp7 family putative phage head morphogenesis protein